MRLAFFLSVEVLLLFLFFSFSFNYFFFFRKAKGERETAEQPKKRGRQNEAKWWCAWSMCYVMHIRILSLMLWTADHLIRFFFHFVWKFSFLQRIILDLRLLLLVLSVCCAGSMVAERVSFLYNTILQFYFLSLPLPFSAQHSLQFSLYPIFHLCTMLGLYCRCCFHQVAGIWAVSPLTLACSPRIWVQHSSRACFRTIIKTRKRHGSEWREMKNDWCLFKRCIYFPMNKCISHRLFIR